MNYTTRRGFGSWLLERHPDLWFDWASHPDIWVDDEFLGWCKVHHPAVVVEWRLFQSTTQQKTGD